MRQETVLNEERFSYDNGTVFARIKENENKAIIYSEVEFYNNGLITPYWAENYLFLGQVYLKERLTPNTPPPQGCHSYYTKKGENGNLYTLNSDGEERRLFGSTTIIQSTAEITAIDSIGSFVELSDTPNYWDREFANYFVKVDNTGSQLEFVKPEVSWQISNGDTNEIVVFLNATTLTTSNIYLHPDILKANDKTILLWKDTAINSSEYFIATAINASSPRAYALIPENLLFTTFITALGTSGNTYNKWVANDTAGNSNDVTKNTNVYFKSLGQFDISITSSGTNTLINFKNNISAINDLIDVSITASTDLNVLMFKTIDNKWHTEDLSTYYYRQSAVDNLFSSYYTKTELSSSGQSTVHWTNLTGVPTLADNFYLTSAWITITNNTTSIQNFYVTGFDTVKMTLGYYILNYSSRISIGYNSTTSSSNYTIAIGFSAKATGDYSVSIGYSAKSSHTNAVVLGKSVSSVITSATHVANLYNFGYSQFKQISSPTVTTDKLYNVGGVLYWNSTILTGFITTDKYLSGLNFNSSTFTLCAVVTNGTNITESLEHKHVELYSARTSTTAKVIVSADNTYIFENLIVSGRITNLSSIYTINGFFHTANTSEKFTWFDTTGKIVESAYDQNSFDNYVSWTLKNSSSASLTVTSTETVVFTHDAWLDITISNNVSFEHSTVTSTTNTITAGTTKTLSNIKFDSKGHFQSATITNIVFPATYDYWVFKITGVITTNITNSTVLTFKGENLVTLGFDTGTNTVKISANLSTLSDGTGITAFSYTGTGAASVSLNTSWLTTNLPWYIKDTAGTTYAINPTSNLRLESDAWLSYTVTTSGGTAVLTCFHNNYQISSNYTFSGSSSKTISDIKIDSKGHIYSVGFTNITQSIYDLNWFSNTLTLSSTVTNGSNESINLSHKHTALFSSRSSATPKIIISSNNTYVIENLITSGDITTQTGFKHTSNTSENFIWFDATGKIVESTYDQNSFDNYQYWVIADSYTNTTNISSTETFTIASGTGISAVLSGNILTINNKSTNTDTNYYVVSASYSSGTLTLKRSGTSSLSSISVTGFFPNLEISDTTTGKETSTNTYSCLTGTTTQFDINIVGTQISGAVGNVGDAWIYNFKGAIQTKTAASTTLVSSIDKTIYCETDSQVSVAITANSASDTLVITITGNTNRNINWEGKGNLTTLDWN